MKGAPIGAEPAAKLFEAKHECGEHQIYNDLPGIDNCSTVVLARSSGDDQGIAEQCAEKKQICFWHKAVVTPPKGWIEDPQWTLRYKAMTMFENGDQSESKPLMYLRTHAGEKELSLDEYVRVAQERWMKMVPDSKIEPLADFVRPGKPVIKVFLYNNPSLLIRSSNSQRS